MSRSSLKNQLQQSMIGEEGLLSVNSHSGRFSTSRIPWAKKLILGAHLPVLAFTVIVAIACAGGAGGNTVRMSEFKFEPANLTGTAGQPFRVALQNAGSVVHDFTVKDLNAASPKVQPGQSVTYEFTPSRAGTFDIVCTEPGHEEGGMVGKLTVQ